ncbi:SH3 domain-containing protein [Qipengyuania sp.]|uniref:SH3 domain-containing protein n=1 Tax=Qipengyuania sp. TaxID=2004515 RepID=UPI0035196D27
MFARIFIPFLLLAGLAAPAGAQDRDVPYWATIRASVLNLRVGPSADYKIDWVYRRPGLPVKVIRLMEGWRLIEDPDGARGWVVARLLSPDRGAIVIGEGLAAMRAGASADAALKWQVEPGVVGVLGDCDDGWCEFAVENRRGYVLESRLWGVGEP